MSLPCTPPVELENDLNIDQTVSDIDTFTCQLNSLFNSLVTTINTLNINGSINLDIKCFIKNTQTEWNNGNFNGANQATINSLIQKANTQFASLPEPQKTNSINQFLNNANNAFKILQWIGSGDRTGQASEIKKSREIPFTINCSDGNQTYANVNDAECNDNCIVNIPLAFVTKTKKNNYTLAKLMQELKKGNVINCAINLSGTLYTTNATSNNTGNEVIATVNTVYPPNFEPLGGEDHAISCIGFECEGDYVVFIFKDSYEYGTSSKRPGIFKIRVHKDIRNTPFGVGNTLALGGDLEFVFCYIPPDKKTDTENNINEAIAKCCPTPTPTPTLTPTPSSTQDIFYEPTPTPSYSF